MPRLDRKQSFGTLLETVTQQRLSQVASDALVELAKQLWYEERDLVPVLQREVASKLREPEQKLRGTSASRCRMSWLSKPAITPPPRA
nr:hypothetical protein [Pseudomonas aeruginosa]